MNTSSFVENEMILPAFHITNNSIQYQNNQTLNSDSKFSFYYLFFLLLIVPLITFVYLLIIFLKNRKKTLNNNKYSYYEMELIH